MPMHPSEIEPRTDREILIALRADIRHLRNLLDLQTKDHKQDLLDHERRIRVLENFRWWLVGGIFSSAGLAAAVARAIH